MKERFGILGFFLLLCTCAENKKEQGIMFKDDVAFLRKHTDVLVLTGENGRAQIAVVPGLQGRVMTSTADGDEGLSFGWINRGLIASGENNRHMNAFGGEDRFWLGPEGGQFSIFFRKGDPFDLEHWWTPPPINEGGYDVAERTTGQVRFHKKMQLENYSGRQFDLELDRIVRFVSLAEIQATFGCDFDVRLVAFQSENTITNIGATAWEKATGLLSIWILGMYNPSPATTIVIPFRPGAEQDLGPRVNDAYFGKVPLDRLIIRDDVIFFRGDGAYRSKIGLSPARATSVLGSYDAANGVLTLVHFSKPDDAVDYVNSMWEIQEAPFAGDVVNSYNDGPAAGAAPMGPFYELETSSPAAALASGESLTHVHTTLHLQGDEEALDGIAKAVLGVGVKEIAQVF